MPRRFESNELWEEFLSHDPKDDFSDLPYEINSKHHLVSQEHVMTSDDAESESSICKKWRNNYQDKYDKLDAFQERVNSGSWKPHLTPTTIISRSSTDNHVRRT